MIVETEIQREPDTLIEQLNTQEKEYLNILKKQYGETFINNKIQKIKCILQEIDYQKALSVKSYDEIQKIAISKGGFLINSYRREFYKKAFNLDNERINLIYYKNEQFVNKSYLRRNYYDEEFIQNKTQQEKSKKYDYVIEVDVKRSIINHFFDREKDEDKINKLKQKLTNFIKKFIIFNEDYHYYQGFHDIALYFYLIFANSEHLAFQMVQRVTEFVLKDYMVEIGQNKHFKFENIFKILNQILQYTNKSISDFIVNNTNETDPIYSLPWIITLFTHDINNYFIVSRIFDFILFSHPSSIFHVATNVKYV